MGERGWVWGSAVVVAGVLFAACGGGGDDAAPESSRSTASEPPADPTTSTTEVVEDIEMQAADFPNINTLTKVGNHFVGNMLGHLDEALAVANSPDGGTYPVGTLIQLVPQEAMVKRAEGWSPGTGDWEFFSLDATPEGTTILTRGKTPVLNRFDMDCAACHGQAEAQWDFVCDEGHGCDPLGLDQAMIAGLQQADPRPR
ncbi:MAG: hypothetical protein ACT4OX_04475 [Actinomycetota bacterium]